MHSENREEGQAPAPADVGRKQEFSHGYDIDRAYQMADRYLVGSDNWHRWMDIAHDLERKHRGA
jgi:hypothetical protein